MTLAEATTRAILAAFAGEQKGRQVLGLRLTEFKAARRSFRAGELPQAYWEGVKQDFDNMLERRLTVIAEEIKTLMATPDRYDCVARIRRTDTTGAVLEVVACLHEATTVIAGRRYCDRHAATAPRLEIPAGRVEE